MSDFVSRDGELHLSNLGQRELLRAMVERGARLRTAARGFSMSPFVRDKDVLTIAPMRGRKPRMGEVVAFIRPGSDKLVIHRIVARSASGWLIRGDNCPEADGIISPESILGRVTRVEREGRDISLGLGPERLLVAWLQRKNLLTRAVRAAVRAKHLCWPGRRP